MVRNFAMVPALALGLVLATGGFAVAQDGTPAKSGFGGTTMTLGGKGTAAQAAAADDTELTWGCRRYYGCGGGWCGYRGYYGGYGGYGGGYYGGYGVNYFSYAPAYYTPYSYYRPYPSLYGGFGYGGPRFGGGLYVGINGTENDATAPAVSLNLAVANNPAVASRATSQPGGTFRYDGGPANPIPLPKPEAASSTQATPPATGLPVSLPKTAAKPASPYTYKAYGEK